jgi:hypothetical protein
LLRACFANRETVCSLVVLTRRELYIEAAISDQQSELHQAKSAIMASPYATGGGGTHFEARVVASYLAAIVCEAPARGLPGEFANQLNTQRASFGDPLDDIILYGQSNNGRRTKLHLQIKNKLVFSENDTEWADVLARAWKTFYSDDFDRTLNRIGVGIGTYNARTDQHFFERISEPDFSHQDRQAFVATTRALLTHCVGRPVDDDELWGFLKAFVIVHFDFQSEGSSRDAENTVERLRHAMPVGQRDQAAALWDHLIATAGDLTPVGGGATRATLVEQHKGAKATSRRSLSSGPDCVIRGAIHSTRR